MHDGESQRPVLKSQSKDMYENDKRVVMTLDAGGTNFEFSAIQGGKERVSPVKLPSVPEDSNRCLKRIAEGFRMIEDELGERPVAISFAFPGPADYAHGIIGDLPNFPGFRGGVALGPYLEAEFGLPTFIHNDGNLFALGEYRFGILPVINSRLELSGSRKRYRNLIGITLGTGFGAGVVVDGRILVGDNGCGGDVWLMRHPDNRDLIVEEGVSIRAVIHEYVRHGGKIVGSLSPKDIYDIAVGAAPGDAGAARASFASLGRCAAHAIVHALDIVDGIVVIGGGLSGAAEFFLPSLLEEMGSHVKMRSGESFPCLQMQVFNLSNPSEESMFLKDESFEVEIPLVGGKAVYDNVKKTGVAISSLGASKAISLGAYSFALDRLDQGKS